MTKLLILLTLSLATAILPSKTPVAKKFLSALQKEINAVAKKVPQGVKQGFKKIGDQLEQKGSKKALQKTEASLLQQAEKRFPRAAEKFNKHANDFTSISGVNAYYKRAVSLADHKVGGDILGFTSKNGFKFRMNAKTGEFLTIKPTGEIQTFYRRMNEPMKYWANQIKKYGIKSK